MADRPRNPLPTSRVASTFIRDAQLTGTAEKLRTTLPSRTVFIDVGGQVENPHVVRDGFEVPVVRLDPELLGEFVFNRPVLETRVVSQSIQPGQQVARGTEIKMTVTSPFQLPGSLVDGGHRGLGDFNIGDIHDRFLDNRVVRRLIATKTSVAELDEREKEQVRAVFSANNVDLDDDDPTRDLDAGFASLRATYAFAGGEL